MSETVIKTTNDWKNIMVESRQGSTYQSCCTHTITVHGRGILIVSASAFPVYGLSDDVGTIGTKIKKGSDVYGYACTRITEAGIPEYEGTSVTAIIPVANGETVTVVNGCTKNNRTEARVQVLGIGCKVSATYAFTQAVSDPDLMPV